MQLDTAIQLLGSTAAKLQFEHIFLGVCSRHHYKALRPGLTCIVASDIMHDELHRNCNGIVHTQSSGINNIRKHLSNNFDTHE